MGQAQSHQEKRPHVQAQEIFETKSDIQFHEVYQDQKHAFSEIEEKPYENEDDENKDDFFNGIGTYCEGDEAVLPQNDERTEVSNPHSSKPYKSIVRVIRASDRLPQENENDFLFGSGVILTPRIVYTVAHNLIEITKQIADYVFVEVQSDKQPKPLIKVIKIGIQKNYFEQDDDRKQEYDLAILILEENTIIQPNMTMKIKNHYDFKNQKKKEVIIAGFPQKVRGKPLDRWKQFDYQFEILKLQKNFLKYHDMTSHGQSGAPIVLKEMGNDANFNFIILGLHKASKPADRKTNAKTFSYGILVTSGNTFQINKIARSFSISNPGNNPQVADKNNKVLELIDQIQLNSNGRQTVELDKIIWKNMTKKAATLNQLVCKVDPQSFRKAIKKIQKDIDKFKGNPLQNTRASLLVIKALFDQEKIKGGVFGKKDQDTYFEILQNYVDFCLENIKNANHAQFYAEIGERLYDLYTKLSFKKNINQMLKDRDLTISRMEQNLIEAQYRIIKKISKVQSLPQDTVKSKQEKLVMELNFLKNMHTKCKKQIDKIQTQDDNDAILLLKAEILNNHGESDIISRSIIFYKRVIETNQKSSETKQSQAYTEAISKLGEIYRKQGKFTACKAYFDQNLKIRKKMDPTKSTIEYAEALNYLALYEIDSNRYEEAKKNALRALEIAETLYKNKQIKLIKFLKTLSVAYYKKAEFTSSLQASQRSLKIIETEKGQNSLEAIDIINNIGATLKKSKDPEKLKKALEYYQKALKIQQTHRGKQNLNCAPILNNIGHLQMGLGNFVHAKALLQQSIEIYEKCSIPDPNDPVNRIGLGSTYFNLGCCLFKTDKFKQAKQKFEKSQAIFKGAEGADDKETKKALEMIQNCKKKIL